MDKQISNLSSFLSTHQPADLYRMQVRELRGYAMFMLDPQGIIMSWNAGVECLLGYPENEWIGQHASLIFTPAEKAVEVCEAELQLAHCYRFCLYPKRVVVIWWEWIQRQGRRPYYVRTLAFVCNEPKVEEVVVTDPS